MRTIILLVLSGLLLVGCVGDKPHDDQPVIFQSVLEKYEKLGYRYVPPVVLSPARLEYVGTNK